MATSARQRLLLDALGLSKDLQAEIALTTPATESDLQRLMIYALNKRAAVTVQNPVAIQVQGPTDSQLQGLLGSFAPVARTGAFADLTDKPVIGSAASLDVGTGDGQIPVSPMPMSVMPNAKVVIDAIKVNSDPAAYRETSYFATAAQGAKADTALQNAAAFATAAQGAKADAGYEAELTYHRDRLTTTNATGTVIRSVAIAQNSLVYIDSILTFLESNAKLTGGYIWATLSFARGVGLPVALGTLDILESRNLSGPQVTFVVNSITGNVDITVAGKAGTSILWSARTTVDRGNP